MSANDTCTQQQRLFVFDIIVAFNILAACLGKCFLSVNIGMINVTRIAQSVASSEVKGYKYHFTLSAKTIKSFHLHADINGIINIHVE